MSKTQNLVSLKDVTIFILSYGELIDEKTHESMLNELQFLPTETKEEWVSVDEYKIAEPKDDWDKGWNACVVAMKCNKPTPPTK